jgi:GT2 family glycosyltransferase
MIKKKPIIAIILYKPEHSTYQRIKMAIGEGYKLYIFDNYPCDKSKLLTEEYRNNIRYFTFDKNMGIGPALKLMCATAYYEGNRELLYFDQDAIYNKETLEYIFGYINESSNILYLNRLEKILSVTFRDAATNRKEKQIQKKISIGNYILNIVDFTISSGTLFYLGNLKKVGWHDEGYYMDGVDYSICLSAEATGLKVAEIFNTPGLDHNAEQANRNYKFLFKTFSGRKYPIYRIKDYVNSSLKLIVKSTLLGSKKKFRILKMLIIYIIIQSLIYISKENNNERLNKK